MTTTRITGTDGKQYDVTIALTLNQATLSPAELALDAATQSATIKPATMQPATATAAVTSVAPVAVAPPAPPASAPGLISSFSAAPKTYFQVDGISYEVQTAGKSYSLTEIDPHTLRFEIHQGDYAWYDSAGVRDRAEIEGSKHMFAPGAQINVAYQFMMEAGAANTASWFVTAEIHNNDTTVATSPPVAIEMLGESLSVVIRTSPALGSAPVVLKRLWTDPKPIVRGSFHNIAITAVMDNAVGGKGAIAVIIDGVQVVNYKGPVGYGAQTYWMNGMYRATVPEIAAAQFRNLNVTTS